MNKLPNLITSAEYEQYESNIRKAKLYESRLAKQKLLNEKPLATKLLGKESRIQYLQSVYEQTAEIDVLSQIEKLKNEINDIKLNLGELSENERKNAFQINRNTYSRKTRLKDKNEEILNSGCAYFITLTFTDEQLEKTSKKTRRFYVREFLNEITNGNYNANIDFGIHNNREHYHGLASIDPNNLEEPKLYYAESKKRSILCSNEVAIQTKYRTKFGWITFQPVHSYTGEEDIETRERVAKYIAKTTNHALKESTEQNRIIYSRRKN